MQYDEKNTRADSQTINGTSVIVLNANLKRKAITIKNTATDSSKIISLAFGNIPAVSGSGIVLNIGDTYLDANSEGWECWKGSVSAICAVAAGSIAIFERE